MSPEALAALFDAFGEVHWVQSGRQTLTGLLIKRIDVDLAKRIRQSYRGSVTVKPTKWAVYGRDSEHFAETILPHLGRKRELIDHYLYMRKSIIGTSGVGRKSTLNDDDIALRQEIAKEMHRIQEELGENT